MQMRSAFITKAQRLGAIAYEGSLVSHCSFAYVCAECAEQWGRIITQYFGVDEQWHQAKFRICARNCEAHGGGSFTDGRVFGSLFENWENITLPTPLLMYELELAYNNKTGAQDD